MANVLKYDMEKCKVGTLIKYLLTLVAALVFYGCQFDQIDLPDSAQPDEIINISVIISDSIDETTNPHKGVLCVLLPVDWTILSANYSGSIGFLG